MLFASAFDTGAASSSTPLALPGKRKRDSKGKDEQLRATQVNLSKLMDKVDKGNFTSREGREGLGQMGKKRKGNGSEKSGPEMGKGKGKGKGEGKFNDKPKFDKPNKAKFDKPKFDKPKADKPKTDKKAKLADKKQTPKDKSSGKKDTKTPKPQPLPQSPKAKPKPKLAPVELDLPTTQSTADDGLTDMQRKMQAKLEGARFRWINEQLYTTSSGDAVEMMDNDPKVFSDYHETHRQLTAAWPSPPLPHIIQLLTPLPKGTVIADLGCGDADLARALIPKGKVVLSYDLVGDVGGNRSVGSEGYVVPCDFLAGVPLPGRPGGGEQPKKKKDPAACEIVDAVVCCLSLMGTNWVGGIYEGARILKQGGAFHIAEVTSRFVSTEAFVDAITSFGLVLESQEEPSTHFTLFKFVKKTPTPVGPVRGQEGWEERVAAGEEILRPCIYKRR